MMSVTGKVVLFALIQSAATAQSHYSVQWDKGYGNGRYFCLPESSVVSSDGDLWLICGGHDYAANKQAITFYRIDGKSGELKFARDLQTELSVSPITWEALHQLTATGQTVGVLTSTTSGGKMQTFEGVYFTPMDADGSPGKAVLVVPKGSQLQEVHRSNDGNIIVTADQGPLSIRKLDPKGTVLWQKVLSSRFDLPTVALFPDGSICLSAQLSTSTVARPTLQLMRLDPLGHVAKQIPIVAAQGAVAAAPGGACAVLYSPTFESRVRRLASFDEKLNRLWDIAVPLDGQGGRTYTLDSFADGFLATEFKGETRAPVVAKFSQAGQLLWLDPLPDGFRTLALGIGATYVITVNSKAHNDSFRVLKIQFEAN